MPKTFLVASRLRNPDGTGPAMKHVVRGSRKQVESYVVGLFTIELASADELVEAGKEGLEIVEAGNSTE